MGMEHKKFRILIIGLGQIGYHNAEYMTRLGLNVEGYDVEQSAIQRALTAKIIQREAKTFAGYDYYLICVSTHNPSNMAEPHFDGLLEIAERLEKEGTEGGLISIESTIAKGISHQICQILRHKLHVAHVPHRFYSEDKKEHGVRQLRVLGGCKNCCTLEALNFYARILRIPVHAAKTIEIAELSKIIENSHRFLEIAFAEELKMFCDNEGLDFEELRAAINSKWNTKILEAREGIGGHCLPKDTQMFFDLEKNTLPFSTLAAAIQSDRLYQMNVAREESFQVIFPEAYIAQKPAVVK
jgi:UDP-N-acetyl-D-mannosaminuronic acid dehydrogenase